MQTKRAYLTVNNVMVLALLSSSITCVSSSSGSKCKNSSKKTDMLLLLSTVTFHLYKVDNKEYVVFALHCVNTHMNVTKVHKHTCKFNYFHSTMMQQPTFIRRL